MIELTLSLTADEAKTLAQPAFDKEEDIQLLDEVIHTIRVQCVCVLALAEKSLFKFPKEEPT